MRAEKCPPLPPPVSRQPLSGWMGESRHGWRGSPLPLGPDPALPPLCPSEAGARLSQKEREPGAGAGSRGCGLVVLVVLGTR